VGPAVLAVAKLKIYTLLIFFVHEGHHIGQVHGYFKIYAAPVRTVAYDVF
jgi:hypothetical protein